MRPFIRTLFALAAVVAGFVCLPVPNANAANEHPPVPYNPYVAAQLPGDFYPTALNDARQLVGNVVWQDLGEDFVHSRGTVYRYTWGQPRLVRQILTESALFGSSPSGLFLTGLGYDEELDIVYSAIWKGERQTNLDPSVWAGPINDSGQFLGREWPTPAITNGSDPAPPSAPRLFRTSNWLGEPEYYSGPDSTYPVGIDPNGNALLVNSGMAILGGAGVSPFPLPQPLVWKVDGSEKMLPQGAIFSSNSAGTMAAGQINNIATLWVGNQAITLVPKKRGQESVALAVNNSGAVLVAINTHRRVGRKLVTTSTAYVYSQGQLTPLATLLPVNRGEQVDGLAINAAGDILVGVWSTGRNGYGSYRYVVLYNTATPENGMTPTPLSGARFSLLGDN